MNGTLRVGTSGYAYKPWKGEFYPEKLPDKEMLNYYATQFSTVEINNTFYRLPTEKVVAQWAASVPAGFQFAMKCNQKITHIMRLKNVGELLGHFLQVASVMQQENKLGPILVQLPPYFKFDAAVLEEFLALRPPAFRFAFEVRHASWHNEDTYSLLRKHDVALCLAETDDFTPPDLLTASFAYLRLRKEEYTPKELAAWRKRFDAWLAQGIDVYVYLKHEDAAKGPAYARALMKE
jgi:uncharacterized protein YecE (DUF72 family)